MKDIIYTITKAKLASSAKRGDKDKKWRYPGVTGPGRYTWSEADNKFYPVQQSEPHDFDTGLGIGGLGRHEGKPIAPTASQIGRMEKLEAKARTCRRCGQTDVFDGAMFTTGGNVCDDCFG